MIMEKERVFKLIEEVLSRDSRLIFAYAYGSFVSEEAFRDIDIGIYVKNPEENPFVISSDIKTQLSLLAKNEGITFTADDFDIRIINDAPFTPLESPGIYAVDYINRKHQLPIEGGVKAPSFLTGFTFLKRVFKEGILLVDKDSDLRTDIIENVSLKYRECTGLLAEASLG